MANYYAGDPNFVETGVVAKDDLSLNESIADKKKNFFLQHKVESKTSKVHYLKK